MTLTIAQENALTDNLYGRAYWFDYDNAQDVIPGFDRRTYYAPGETAQFSIDYNQPYTVTIYRLGYYGGAGARQQATFAGSPLAQPAPVVISGSNGAVDCSNWTVNVSWSIPTDATPGWYWLFCKNAASTAFGGILFCVTDVAAKQPIVVMASDATWHAAYNGYAAQDLSAGNNVYGDTTAIGNAAYRALCSSYDKPVISRRFVPQTHFFDDELPMLRFFERFGYNVGYVTCEQVNNDPTVLDGRSLIIFNGHNEYVSQRIRDKVAERISAGVNVANFAANDFFWKTRYGGTAFPTSDTSTGRVMWVKKDTMDGPVNIRSGGGGTPFTTAADWTGTWQDTRWTGRQPSNGLLGDTFIANGIRTDAVQVPASMKALPIWRNCTGIQALATGASFSFGAGTAGMEWDMPDPSGGLRQTPLSASVVDLTGSASDANGQNYNLGGTYTHAFQVTANGNSRIFNANTTQWGWALDDLHLRGAAISTPEARQATLNILADLGALPVSTLVTGASLTMPTPVSSFDAAYSLAGSGGLKLGAAGVKLMIGSAPVDKVYLGTTLVYSATTLDTTAPTVPTALASTGITSTGFQVTWTASTDAVGVTGYQVRLNGGTPVAANGSLSHTFTGLAASTAYTVEVRAGDAAGNWSAWSSVLNVTTSAATVVIEHFFDGATIPGIDAPTYGTDLGTGGMTGISFYATTKTITVKGVRIYTPASASPTFASLAATVACYGFDYQGAYFANGTALGTPLATKTLTGARTLGAWTDILFDSPVTIAPSTSTAGSPDCAFLALKYPAGQYALWSSVFTTASPVPSPSGNFYLAERDFPRNWYSLGTTNVITRNVSGVGPTWYGLDIICTTA